MELVKNIIINLAKNLNKTRDVEKWEYIPLDEFLKKNEMTKAVRLHMERYFLSVLMFLQQSHSLQKPRYSSLFATPDTSEEYEYSLVASVLGLTHSIGPTKISSLLH